MNRYWAGYPTPLHHIALIGVASRQILSTNLIIIHSTWLVDAAFVLHQPRWLYPLDNMDNTLLDYSNPTTASDSRHERDESKRSSRKRDRQPENYADKSSTPLMLRYLYLVFHLYHYPLVLCSLQFCSHCRSKKQDPLRWQPGPTIEKC